MCQLVNYVHGVKGNQENQILKNNQKTETIKANKNRIIRDIKNRSEQQEEHCYKLVRIGDFYSNNYIERESDSDRYKTLSIKEYLDKIKPYF